MPCFLVLFTGLLRDLELWCWTPKGSGFMSVFNHVCLHGQSMFILLLSSHRLLQLSNYLKYNYFSSVSSLAFISVLNCVDLLTRCSVQSGFNLGAFFSSTISSTFFSTSRCVYSVTPCFVQSRFDFGSIL